MKIRPLHDWALIERSDAGDVTTGGIHIPDSARERPAEGTVLAIGPGKFRVEKGKEKKKTFVPTSVVPGQHVMFVKYMATEIELAGLTHTLIREEDILCTVEGTERPLTKSSPRTVLVPTGPAPKSQTAGRKAVTVTTSKKSKSAKIRKKIKKSTVKSKTKKTVKKISKTVVKKSPKTKLKKKTKKTARKVVRKSTISKKKGAAKKQKSSKKVKNKK